MKALRQLGKIDRRYVQNIRNRVDELKHFPQVSMDLKKIDHQYRLRVGNYRIFFEVIDGEPKIIEIQEIQRRQSKTY
ncbi:mRNA-degrading endonuclease RelE of RelBE toxin-antitoxin system [Neisseria sp. HSC-16F19]|nr:type II toxin-antitoxin system RelE/ParE family toxin [Neisseria sp. HSC-16F19]MCP2041914.1 mRNA-degrading endonuclease RelE of RelBE toxin-antitoxin system [Neisseria sp. HSC-16F19]